MSTKSKMIAGVAFDISQPYTAGHTITEAEAKVLNQTRAENIGNNLRTQVKEAVESGDAAKLAEARDVVAKYDSEYVFTLANVAATRKLDPVEKEARSIARDIIKQKLAESGRKWNTAPDGYTDDTWSEYLEGKLDEVAAADAVVAEAKKRVKAKEKFQVTELTL